MVVLVWIGRPRPLRPMTVFVMMCDRLAMFMLVSVIMIVRVPG